MVYVIGNFVMFGVVMVNGMLGVLVKLFVFLVFCFVVVFMCMFSFLFFRMGLLIFWLMFVFKMLLLVVGVVCVIYFGLFL